MSAEVGKEGRPPDVEAAVQATAAARPVPPTTRGLFALGAVLGVPLLLSLPLADVLSPFDPEPWVAASGWSALSVVLCALSMAWRTRGVPRGAALGVLGALAIALGALFGAGAEPLESSRALFTAAAALGAFVLSASMTRDEHRWLARGWVVVALVHGLPTLAGGAVALAGPLQNTGYANQVLLVGAAAGAVLATEESRAWTAAAIAAVGVALTQAALAPTLLGALAFAIATGAAAVGPRGRRGRTGLAVAALAGALVVSGRIAPLPLGPGDSKAIETVVDGGDFGGVAVRRAIWSASLPLVAQAGPTGVGSGRFRAEFPRYRDLEEARASELDGALGTRTEVEHPHNDWLLPWIESGWLGGLAWTAFLGAAAVAACAACGSRRTTRAAVGAAGLAVAVNAAAHSNLLFNPLSAILGASALGACAGDWRPLARPLRHNAARLVAAAPALLLLLAPLAPWQVVRSGNALARSVELSAGLAAGNLAVDQALLDSLTERFAALETAIDASGQSSATALELAARRALRDNAPVSAAEYVNALSTLRPYSLASYELAGLLAIERGQLSAGEEAFARLVRARPDDPDAVFNLARLRLELGDARRALALLEEHPLDGERRVALARDAQLGGWIDPNDAVALLAPAFDDASPDAFFDRAAALRDTDSSPLTRAALECLAQHLWARDHAAAGDFKTAARSYRQAWRASKDADQPGSPLIGVELAAAEALAGYPERSDALLEELGDRASDPGALVAPWARAALQDRPR